MNRAWVSKLCVECFSQEPEMIEHCTVGHGNYVFSVSCAGTKYIFRFTTEQDAYSSTVYWLEKLREVGVPVPRIVAKGRIDGSEYLVLTYIEGRDIGAVYNDLSSAEKRAIARQVVRIQNQTALLEPVDIKDDWTWKAFVDEMLDRAEQRIIANGYFDAERVWRLRKAAQKLESYFDSVKPNVYLDDISTKNLLIHNGQVSGVIDVDWIGIGDRLTFVALTYIALLNMDCDTDYVSFLLEEMNVTDIETEAFVFYALMYCVDFMGERGMRFLDRQVEVNDLIIERLHSIYDMLWEQWIKL